jgi:hypothetical protein
LKLPLENSALRRMANAGADYVRLASNASILFRPSGHRGESGLAQKP